MHGVNALPVAGGALPSERIALPCCLVKRSASKPNVLIEVGMTLRRSNIGQSGEGGADALLADPLNHLAIMLFNINQISRNL